MRVKGREKRDGGKEGEGGRGREGWEEEGGGGRGREAGRGRRTDRQQLAVIHLPTKVK